MARKWWRVTGSTRINTDQRGQQNCGQVIASSPDEVQMMIEGAKQAVYEAILQRKSWNAICNGSTRHA